RARPAGSSLGPIDAGEIVRCAHGDVRYAAPGLSGLDRNRQVRLRLIARDGKDLADAAAGCPTAAPPNVDVERRAIVPRDVLVVVDRGPAAAEHKIVDGRMIDMNVVAPIPGSLIRRSVVAGRGTDGDACRGCRQEQFVEGVDALLVPGDFRSPPTDRD